MNHETGTILWMIAAYAVFGIALIVIGILFLMAIYKLLQKCSPENRTMEPGLVWLWFIPLFGLYWQFVVVNNVAMSLQKEFKKRSIAEEELPGKKIGLPMCILTVVSIIPIPVISTLVGIAGLVYWILYWVKIRGFSQKLGSA